MPVLTPNTDQVALAVDIGGTKFAAAIVSPSGEIVVAQRVPTPQDLDPEVLFEALAGVIDATLLAAGLSFTDARLRGGIGVGTAAPMDLNSGTVSPVNIPGWRLFPLRDKLTARYGVPVGMIGDAVAVAVGEHWKGAARGNNNVLGMVVSTGVGGGLILGAGCCLAPPATRVISATPRLTPTGRCASAAGSAAWRPLPVACRWRAGRGSTGSPAVTVARVPSPMPPRTAIRWRWPLFGGPVPL